MEFPFAFTVTVRRGGGKDAWGDPKPTTTHEIPGCIKWPRSSTETLDRSDAVSTGWMLSVPVGSDLLATDEVLLPGDPEPWQVDGEPLPYESPFTGWKPGTPVGLIRTTG